MNLGRIHFNNLLLFSVLVACKPLYAQVKELDSLTQMLSTKSGIDRYEYLFDITVSWANAGRFNEALSVVEDARELASEYGDSILLTRAFCLTGQILVAVSRLSEGKEFLMKTLTLAERQRLKRERLIALNNLALIHTMEGDYGEALKLHLLRLREVRHDTSKLATSLQNIGLIYYKMKHYTKAIEFYDSAFLFRKKIAESYSNTRLLINKALCYLYMNDYSNGKKYLAEVPIYCEREHCTFELKVDYPFALGLAEYGMGNYDVALTHFKASISAARDAGDQRYEAENLLYIARLYFNAGKTDLAEHAWIAGEQVAAQGKYVELLLHYYSDLADFFLSKARDYYRASQYQAKYISLRDSVYSGQLTINLMRLNAEFQERSNDMQIEVQERMLVLKEEMMSRQKTLNVLIGISAGGFMLAGGILFIRYRRRKFINRALEVKVMERTRTIEDNIRSLRAVGMINDRRLERTIQIIKDYIASIRGISQIGTIETKVPGEKKQFAKMQSMCDLISRLIQRAEDNLKENHPQSL